MKEIIIEIIRSGIWWPITLLILGLIILFKFDDSVSLLFKSLSDLIDRIKKIGKTGMEMEPKLIDQQQASEDLKKDDVKEIFSHAKEARGSKFDEIMKSLQKDDDTYKETEEIIKTSLEEFKLKHEQQVALLVKITSNLSLAYSFEITYSVIFGGQITILLHLNTLVGIGATREHLKHFYDDALSKYPSLLKGYSFTKYINFLVESLLILEEGGKYLITKRGLSFLNYIFEAKKTIHLPG